MGQIADTLRATLRDLAQSDARLYRGLQEELFRCNPSPQPANGVAGRGGARQPGRPRAVSVKVLWGLCKERGIKGLSSGPKTQQIEALLNHPDGPPPRSALPIKASKGVKATGNAGGADLQHLEQRLDRLELLVLLIAQQVGVPPEAIAQRLAASPPPPS